MDIEFRNITDQEIQVLLRLLSCSSEMLDMYGNEIGNLLVCPMKDGGMGSLLIHRDTVEPRRYGKSIAHGQFIDKDDTIVSIALNVDQDDKLFELDSWKVDFSKLLSWPSPETINVSFYDGTD